MVSPTCTVLIVENFLPDRELYRRSLLTDTSYAYRVLEVDTADEGLALCRTEAIDAILLDYLLPDADGLEFLQALHAQSGRDIPPVVIVTGQGDETVAVQAIKLGAEDYLVKRRLTPDLLRLTVRSAIENARLRLQLQQSDDRFRVSIENMMDCFGICSALRDEAGQILDFRVDYLNAAALESNQMTRADLGRGLCEIFPAHREGLFEEYCQVVETGAPLAKETLIYSDVFGTQFLTRAFDIHASKLNDGLVLSWRDVTTRKQVELERQQQLERERIINRITHQIRQSLDLREVLHTTVTEVRQLLSADRAFVYRFNPDFSGMIVVESVAEGLLPALHAEVEDTYFLKTHGEDYRQGRIQVVEDIYTAGLTDCHVEMLERFQIRANLVVPILQGERLWGLLVLSQCACPRRWLPEEIDLLRQLAAQLGIALTQAELYGQLQAELTQRQRTEAALQQSHDRLELSLEGSQQGIWDYNLVTDQAYWSPHCKRLFGLDPDDSTVTNEQFLNCLHGDDRDRVGAAVQDVLETHCNYDIEYRIVWQDGTVRWIHARAKLLRDSQGQPFQMIGTVMDVTDRKCSEAKRKQAEAALQESEQRFRELFNTTYQFVGLLSPDGTLLEANQTALDFGGLSREEVLGRPFWEVRWWTISPQTQQQLRAAIVRAAQGEFVRYEVEVLGREDNTTTIDFSLKPLRDASGQVVLLIPEGRDISERKRSEAERKQNEQQLRESEERLQLGVQVAGVALAHFDYASNQVTLSPEAAVLFGIPAEELGSKRIVTRDRIHTTFHPEEREELMATIQQVLDPVGEGWFAREHRVVWSTGEVRWLNVRKQVFFDRSCHPARPNYALLAAIDITDRKRDEAALQQSEERYRSLAGLIPQLVWIADPSGILLDLNDRWQEYTGLTLAEVQIAGWEAVVHPEDVAVLAEAWMTAQQVISPYQAEGRMRRADGVYRWHLHQAMPLKDEQGQIVKWFGTATDIHDMKLLEMERARLLSEAEAARAEAEAANRSKDDFVALVAHELRSPLNAIMGWAKLLRTRQLDEATTQKALETIVRNTQAQVQLIEDLLDVSRMVRGTLHLTFATVNLVEVIESAIETVQPTAATKPLHLLIDLQPTDLLWGDADRLQQVILNLLTNAIKFTPAEGRVEVRLEQVWEVGEQGSRGAGEQGSGGAGEQGSGGAGEIGENQPNLPLNHPSSPHSLQYAQLTVTDTGKGISPDFLPYVFDRFQQDQQNVAAKEGLGLGLAIVKYLVQMHGGTVAVASCGMGQGATFTVRLPILPSQGGGELYRAGEQGAGEQGSSTDREIGDAQSDLSLNHSSTHPPIHPSTHPLTGFRILLVDDELDMLHLTAFVLEEYGAIVQTANSVVSALAQLEQFQPHVLLSDIAMPGQDGYDLLRQVRSGYSGERFGVGASLLPRAIALTAYAGQDSEERVLQAGFQRCLTKPIEPTQLVSAILSVVGRL